MKSPFAAASLVACLAATSSVAQVQVPGSLLMFPLIHNSGSHLEVVSVTNTETIAGGAIAARYIYTTWDPAAAACVSVDRLEFLTAADTLSLVVTCHSPLFGDGYLVISAADPTAPPPLPIDVSFNRLVGSVISFDAVTGLVYTYDPIAIRSQLPMGTPTDLNGDTRRNLDGLEYDPVSRALTFDSLFASINPELCLVNLTGPPGATNTVVFSTWNDNEMPYGVTAILPCWSNTRTTVLSPMFSNVFLLGTLHDPTELDVNCDGIGDFETAWCIIDSTGVTLPSGISIATDGVLMGVVSNAPGARHFWGTPGLQTNGSL